MRQSKPTQPWVKSFGGLSIESGSRTIDVTAKREQELYGLLCIHPNRKHEPDDIAVRMWPDEGLADTRARINTYVYNIKKKSLTGRQSVDSIDGI